MSNKTLHKTLVIIFFVATVFVVYLGIKILDPNYIEFGPWVSFYKSKDCVDFSDDYVGGKGCYVYGGRDSMYRTQPKLLQTVIMNVQKRNKDLSSRLPKAVNGWECWIQGKEIPDPSHETIINSYYKCWPK